MNTALSARQETLGESGKREAFRAQLESWQTRMERALAARLPEASVVPARLHEAMRYSVLGGGKRIRPALVFATAQALGLTEDEVEAAANVYLERIEQLGGAVAAIEARFMQEEIEAAAYSFAKSVDDGEKVVVGVNRFADEEDGHTEVFPVDAKLQQLQIDRTKSVRAARDQAAVDRALADVAETAKGDANLLVPMKAALEQMATLGEVADVLRAEFGVYQPGG